MRLVFLYLLGFVIYLQTSTSVAQSNECPFDDIGDSVIVAISIQSWDSMWESIRAPELGNRILEGIQEDLLPAILEKAEGEANSATLESRMEDLSDDVNWNDLASSPMSFLVWKDEFNLPVMTLKVEAEEGTVESVEEALADVLRVFGEWGVGAKFRQEDGRSILSYPIDEKDEDWVFLERKDNSVWINFHHTIEDALAGEGLKAREGFSELWNRGQENINSSLVIDFNSLSETIKAIVEESASEWSSSLVLDETMEALFKDDLETLEKLKEVEADMDSLTGRHSENYNDPIVGLVDKLGDLGLLVSMSGQTENGIESLTFWNVDPEADFRSIVDSPPLTERFLSLVTPDLLRGSVYSIPDLGEVYDYILEVVRGFPDGGNLLEAWEEIQTSVGLNLKDELSPALGNEIAMLTRRAKKASIAGFRLVNNESYFLIEAGKGEAVEKLLKRLDEFLQTYQLVPTKAMIGDVTFTKLAAGLMGEVAWGWDRDTGILVVTTTPQADHLPVLMESLRTPSTFSFEAHPRWEDLRSVSIENPTAIIYDDLSTTWQQQVDELKGAKMMFSLMGGGDPITLGIIGLAMEILMGIPAPDAYFRMDSEEENLKISHSILLFPESEPDTGP